MTKARSTLRVAYIGVSHWHTHLYVEPVKMLSDVVIVGVSDPADRVARRWGKNLNCEWSADFREICRRTKPDFVFALGRHCDMAAEANFLIDEGISFAMEKPCGVSTEEVATVAQRARAQSAFAAVPFVFRQSSMAAHIERIAARDRFEYLSFRWIGGPPSRYPKLGVSWMLDPSQSGGGCLLNLGVHFIDLYRFLVGTALPEVRAATVANLAWDLPIEDYALLTLTSGDSIAIVETGYTYPHSKGTFDLRYSIRTSKHYFIASDGVLEVTSDDNRRRTLKADTDNVPVYPVFVKDVLNRFRSGLTPVAGLQDMSDVMLIVQQAYAIGASG